MRPWSTLWSKFICDCDLLISTFAITIANFFEITISLGMGLQSQLLYKWDYDRNFFTNVFMIITLTSHLFLSEKSDFWLNERWILIFGSLMLLLISCELQRLALLNSIWPWIDQFDWFFCLFEDIENWGSWVTNWDFWNLTSSNNFKFMIWSYKLQRLSSMIF